MEIARLVLDYVKILVWPLIVFVGIFVFTDQIRDMAKRIESLALGPASAKLAKSSTGTEGRKGDSGRVETPSAIWLQFHRTSMTQQECLNVAEKALLSSNFTLAEKDSDKSVLGIFEEYLGIIWCIRELGIVFFAVSGPQTETAKSKVYDMVAALEKLSP
jgi:hypothetical protein